MDTPWVVEWVREWWLDAVLISALVPLFLRLRRHEDRRRAQLVDALVAAFGRSVDEEPAAAPDPRVWWRGVVRGVPVHLELDTFVVPDESELARLQVRALGVPAGVDVRPRGWFARIDAAARGDGVRTGDRAFDDAICVRGQEGAVLAACDHAGRAAARAAIERGAFAERGAWIWDFSPPLYEPHQVVAAVTRLVNAACAWGSGDETEVDRLTVIARTDPVDGVRARAFGALSERIGLVRAAPIAAQLLAGRAPSSVLRVERAASDQVSLGVAAAVCVADTGGAEEVAGLRAWEAVAAPEVKPLFQRVLALIDGRADRQPSGDAAMDGAEARPSLR